MRRLTSVIGWRIIGGRGGGLRGWLGNRISFCRSIGCLDFFIYLKLIFESEWVGIKGRGGRLLWY